MLAACCFEEDLMRNIKPLLLMFVFMMFTVNLSAAPVIIKLASIAPERSPWGVVLERLASEWKKITKGEVVLRIYHNGVAGTEEDILAKARLNQLQAGVITASGLSNLSPEVLALSIPFLIKDEAELDRALAGTADYMAEKISEKGFTVLAWSKVGWINFFSKKEVRTPDDLRATKLAGGVSSDTMV
jgi:TRAP-type transport system periplasmic protein